MTSTTTSSTATVQTPTPGTYEVDTAASRVAFTTKHLFGTGTVTGTFPVRSGQIVVADPVAGSQVRVAVSAQQFDTGNPKRDVYVRSAAMLDAETHPEIAFSSTGLFSRDDRWVLAGNITVRGAEAPIELTVVEVRTDTAGLTLRATVRVDRYAHGITKKKGFAARYLNLDITARASLV